MNTIGIIISVIIGLAAGGGAGYVLGKALLRRKMQALSQAEADIEAQKTALAQSREQLKKESHQHRKRLEETQRKISQLEKTIEERRKALDEMVREAESRRTNLISEAEALHKKALARQEELLALEKDLSRRQEEFQRQLASFQRDLEKLEAQREAQETRLKAIIAREEALSEKEKAIEKELEAIAGLTREEALERLMENLKAEAERKAHTLVQRILDEAQLKAVEESQRIIATVMSRVGVEQSIEASITVFSLESDEHKGRIIGREGRNIRTLEALTGVEVVVDDTPNAILLSSPDPIRREIASRTLQRLLADGRVHPARIEEVVEKVRQELDKEIRQIGHRTLMDLDIRNVDPFIRDLAGKMRFRFSFGQNLLHHSREVARLAALIASELGLSKEKIRLAKRAGFFHDIGKVSDENPELPHALLGMEILRRYNEHPEVLNAVGAHHDEIEMTSIISPIVQLADAISGARPGARRETIEKYIQRIQELENIPKKYPGVRQAYALQAGRELRIIVDSDRVTDELSHQIAQQVAKTIETSLQYPGQIKVTVIREKRAEAYAR